MTIASATNKSGPYVGNGVTTVFPYGFSIADASHIKVISTTAAGVETVLVLTTDYTVSGVGSASGSITRLVAPAVGVLTTNVRNVPFTQPLDLVNQGAYFAEVVEAALDLAAARDQQIQEQVSRSVKLPASADSSTLDALVANINSLAAVAPSLATVAGMSANITALLAIAANITTVAGVAANVTTVAGISVSVTTVAGMSANIAAIIANAANINTVAGAIANVNAVGGAIANVNTVAGISANITTVAGISANVATLAGISANITTVAAISAAVTSVNANATAITSAYTNIAAIIAAPAAAAASASSAVDAYNYMLAAQAAAGVYTPTADQVVAASAITTVAAADLIAVVRPGAPNLLKKITDANFLEWIVVALGSLVSGRGAKSTPVDADQFPMADSASSNLTVKLSWLNLLNGVWARLGGLIAGGTSKATPVDADKLGYANSASSNATVYMTVLNLWANYLKAKADALYVALVGGQTLTGGFNATSANLGTLASFTVAPLTHNLQYGTNNGAITLTAPATDCSVSILITNGASAGTITFSGFTVGSNTGDTYALTNAQLYVLQILRINGTSTYVWKALQ